MKALQKKPAISSARPLPRPELAKIPTAVHGGIDPAELARLGLDEEQILDFSVNTNPFGPPTAVRDALANVPLDRYPDPEALTLRQALAHLLDLPCENILAGNGASELICLVALTFLRRGTRVLILGPTYCEYARSAALMGASVKTLLARPEDGFEVHSNQFLRALRRFRPRLVFLCNPNNPTGTFLDPQEIALWARKFPGTMFVVDEAYLGFQRAAGLIPPVRHATAGMNPAAHRSLSNLLLLRSMTKDLGLAGLRLGYAAGSADVISWLNRARPPWSVNALAQAAGIEALRQADYYRDSVQALAVAKTNLIHGMSALGFNPVPSSTPFFLLPVGDGAAFRLSLLRKGVLVRDCTSFGLPAFVRISTRRPEDNARLLSLLGEVPHAG